MIRKIKKILYFPLAAYFSFFAKIYLKKWAPTVVVITGSQGKTTLLHLVESQLGERAIYSHHANSSFGVAFHILGLKRKTFGIIEWPIFFLRAPFQIFRKIIEKKIYVVEVDTDRPGEGEFMAKFLNPNIVLWTGISRTHSMNFKVGKNETIEKVTAYDFAYLAEYARNLVIVNGDIPEVVDEMARVKAKIEVLKKKDYLSEFIVKEKSVEFKIEKNIYEIPALVPEAVACSVKMTQLLCKYFNIEMDNNFSKFILPPGRSSVLVGIKDVTIIDSSYNASLESVREMLDLFEKYPKNQKWIVLGDMIELGKYEKEEHIKLAEYIKKLNPANIVFVGPRLSKYTYHALDKELKEKTVFFDGPAEALEYLLNEINGGEVILFKGARFLEGIIEKILYNKEDAKFLPRRDEVWQSRRKKWKI